MNRNAAVCHWIKHRRHSPKLRLLLASGWNVVNYKVSVPIITVGPLSSIRCAHVYV